MRISNAKYNKTKFNISYTKNKLQIVNANFRAPNKPS